MAGGNRLATSERPIRDMALLNLQLQLAAPPWRPRLQSALQMRGREQQADTARRKRSARVCPSGSGQGAGAAQGSGVRARRVADSTTWTAAWASVCQAAWTTTGLAPARVRTQ